MSVIRATMDIGTNACRLILAEIGEGGDCTLIRLLRIPRIGEGLGRGSLSISRAAMERTLAVLEEYRDRIAAYPVDRVRLLGTQALREADNSRLFAAEVMDKTGFMLEIISGEQEAYLSYTGALTGLAPIGITKPLVLDIGAGSTELIFDDTEANAAGLVRGASAPVGCLRLLANPMNAREIRTALTDGWSGLSVSALMPGYGSRATGTAAYADDGVATDDRRTTVAEDAADAVKAATSMKDDAGVRRLVAVGGTATTLGAIRLQMHDYDPEALLGLRIGREQVEETLALLERMSPAQRLALPGMMPGREDVMPWGLRILLAAMEICAQDSVVICDRDLLYGALYD